MPEITLEISSLALDGRGVGRCRDRNYPEWSNMTVFARGALPGETARVKILTAGANYAEGVKTATITAMPDCVPPFCPQQGSCGGCPLQPMPYEQQLAWKGRIARENLARLGKMDKDFVDAKFEEPIPSPNLRGFRNKMEFAFGKDSGGTLILGQRRQASLEVVETPECSLLPKGHAPILSRMVELARASGLAPWEPALRRGATSPGAGFWRHFILRHGQTRGGKTGWLAVCVTSPGNRAQRRRARNIGETLLSEFADFLGFAHEEARGGGRRTDRRPFSCGETVLLQEIGGRQFALDIASFAQVNTLAANRLGALAQEMALANPGGDILDLYCGAGAPGQLLAPAFSRLFGVDSQEISIAMAAKNATNLDNCAYRVADVEVFLRQNNQRHWRAILADPPRAGLGAASISHIRSIRPEEIVYISCNPATFARDAALLGADYSLDRLGSVDLFPHTAHLELCSRWILRQ